MCMCIPTYNYVYGTYLESKLVQTAHTEMLIACLLLNGPCHKLAMTVGDLGVNKNKKCKMQLNFILNISISLKGQKILAL